MTTLNTIIEEEKEYKVFDCFGDGCGECEVCEYLLFREWAEGCAPAGSAIERSEIIEDYLKRKDVYTTTAMQRAYEAGAEAERQRIIKDIETDPEIPIPRPYEVAWILSKLQLHEILTPLPDNK